MQEEQRSLSSVETLSVWKLLMDDSVRWQVLTVVVINIGMQLSGIDAVSMTTIVTGAVLSQIWKFTFVVFVVVYFRTR